MTRLSKCLAAVEQHSGLNAWTQMLTPSGVSDGMIFGIKDNFCVKDSKTTAGSKMLQDFIAPYDATAVHRIRESGGVILGKTNMDEFGMGSYGVTSYFGPTFSPNGRVAGGSSSGSAAAVASGMCEVAIGSDTGGSVRLPAAYCNIIGFKPTYGRISRWGLIPYASSLDCVGVLASTVNQVESVLNTIHGPDNLDTTCVEMGNYSRIPKRIRVGIPVEFNVSELSNEMMLVWKTAAENMCQELDAEIVPVSIPSIRCGLPAYYVIACAEAASNLAKYDGIQYGHRSNEQGNGIHADYIETRSEGFGPEVQKRLLMGSFVLSSDSYDAYYMNAKRIRDALKLDFKNAFLNADVLLAPVSANCKGPTLETASKLSSVESYVTDVMTVPASLAGLPCISMPSITGVNIQLISPFENDFQLLEIAKLCQGKI